MTKLSMLEGREGPEWLSSDLAQLAELPAAARDELWPIVEPAIAEPMPVAAEARLSEFCARHRIPAAVLSRSLRAVRFLYRTAAQTGSPKNKLEDDVKALLGDGAAIPLALVGRFHAPAMATLSSEIHTKTLLGHGKVLTDFEWRLSRVTTSTHGRGLELPVVTLTLKYQEGGKAKTITFDAVPSVLKSLRNVLDGLLH